MPSFLMYFTCTIMVNFNYFELGKTAFPVPWALIFSKFNPERDKIFWTKASQHSEFPQLVIKFDN